MNCSFLRTCCVLIKFYCHQSYILTILYTYTFMFDSELSPTVPLYRCALPYFTNLALVLLLYRLFEVVLKFRSYQVTGLGQVTLDSVMNVK